MTSNLYRISPHSCFLTILTDFILDNFSSDFSSLRVILPNGLACLDLKNKLIERQKIAILPNIFPFYSINAEGAEIFTISSKNINVVTYLEEKIILAEIIRDYKKLRFNINHALSFAPKLAQLFYALIVNNIPIGSIKNLSAIDQARHWQNIYEFLEYAYKEWQFRISLIKKSDKAHYQIDQLKAEINNLANGKTRLIVAGMFGENLVSWQFLNKNGYIILPPIANLDDQEIKKQTIAKENPLYCLQRLLTILDKNLSDIHLLGDELGVSSINKLMVLTSSREAKDNLAMSAIKYFEYENIFNEAEAIANLCLQQQYINKKIAVIVNNEKTKDIYCNFLSKHSLIYDDLTGYSLRKTHEIHLIFSISDFICNIFDLKKLILLLKNPLISSEKVVRLEKLLNGKNRFVSNWQQLDNLIATINDQQFLIWYQNIRSLLDCKLDSHNFTKILTSLIIITEKLCESIWSSDEAIPVYEFLTEIIVLNWSIELDNITDFPEILKSLSLEARSFSEYYSNANIVLLDIESAALSKFDLIILTNFNEGALPVTDQGNPWFNRQMQDELQLYAPQIAWGKSLYEFYLILHNTDMVITRAKRQDGKNELLPSSYLQKLQFILALPSIAQTLGYSSNIVMQSSEDYIAKSNFFPSKISATDVELLMRSPYSFYAKNILKLRRQETIIRTPTLAEFGSFVHKAFEQYAKTNISGFTKDALLEHISKTSFNVLEQTLLPSSTKRMWHDKFAAIADEFIEFDLQYRAGAKEIYTEITGEMNIETSGQITKIVAVADRIHIDASNRAMIFDYKTGAVPTSKEIMFGLSPQLVIIALIAINGGFGFRVNDVPRLVYVKIASSSPYIKITEINLTAEELQEHFIGLQNLLKEYINCKIFSAEFDLLKYNDYKGLMRSNFSMVN